MYYVNDGVYGSFDCMQKGNTVINLKIPPDQAGLSPTLHYASFWGLTCDGIDCITPKCYLPEMEIGQWLYLENMGAYTNTASSGFNGFARPLMIYVSLREDFSGMFEQRETLQQRTSARVTDHMLLTRKSPSINVNDK